MFKNTEIKFYRNSSKSAGRLANEASSPAVSNVDVTDLYRKAVQSKIDELMRTPDGEITEKRIQQFKLILDKLPKPKNVVSEKVLSKDANNIIEKAAFQTDNMDANDQGKSSILLQQILGKKLKPLQQQSKTEETNHAAINSLSSDSRKFAVNETILSSVKLKQSDTTKLVNSNNENKNLSELEEKLARRRAMLEEENTENTDSVVNEENLSEEVINIAFHARRVNFLSTIIEESENQRNSIFFTPIIETSATDSETSDNNDPGLREFEEMEKQITLETLLQKKLEEAEKQLEEALRELIGIDIESANSISKTITPISFYSKNFSSTRKDEPIIVEAIRKPSFN